MTEEDFPVSGEVKIFQVENPWIYVAVPRRYSRILKDFANRGLIAVKVSLGNSIWDTSLMPMGDGTHFIPLNAKVRKAENINIGDIIKLSFSLRDR